MDAYDPRITQDSNIDTIIPIYLIHADALSDFQMQEWTQSWIAATKFQAAEGQILLLPDNKNGDLKGVILGLGSGDDPFVVAALSQALPPGTYRLVYDQTPDRDRFQDALAWCLGAYRYGRYKQSKPHLAQLQLDPSITNAQELRATAQAISLGRDLITTPANDMGPEDIAKAAENLAERHQATYSQIVGDQLLTHNFPLVHAVGQASDRPPRLIEFTWGDDSHPKITLVGKGVAFDTGGLNIKPAAGMAVMKKDMGGAACVLALAAIIMDTELPVQLKVIIPAVDNAISGSSFRPGDVFNSRSGHTIEIGNTDAEGRLILADALTYACETEPELIIDMATLTGAARVALGTEIPALFSSDDALAKTLQETSIALSDPLWHMPLWAPYRKQLESKIADINHISSGPYGGAITAALFLSHFVPKDTVWAHIDLMAYNPTAKPGRPLGGEVQGVHALYAYLKSLYGRETK